MNVYHVQDGDRLIWDDFVNRHPMATSYHQYSWRKIIENSFRHSCYYLAAQDNGSMAGVLPLVHMQSRIFGNFLVSVPFVNYGGLLCDSKAAEIALLSEAEKIRQHCGSSHVELRHLGIEKDQLPSMKHKVTMILSLNNDEDVQWKGFNAKLRNQIRKAEKSGLESVIGHLNLLDGFYEVFTRNMRDLGTPVYSKEFFRNVLLAFPDSSRIFGVLFKEKFIAAGIGCCFRDSIEIPWASSISDFKSYCPNNLLYWDAIKFAISNGISKFDFGRSTPNEGTYNFKKQWGAEPVQLFWQYLLEDGIYLPNLNPKNPKYNFAIKVWQRLPVLLTRIVGPRIVRSIP